jgi:1,4-alpha-glucan branching enzyme
MKSRGRCKYRASSGAAAKTLWLLILLTGWGKQLQSNAADATSHQIYNIEFSLHATNTTVVSLVGEFNNWDPKATPMQKTNGEWRVTAQLKPGCYQYKFFVDGRWICDPENPNREKDAWTQKNSWILVRPDGDTWKPTEISPTCR